MTTANGGDDDKPPAYKIYIDPETGRYTTEDPVGMATVPTRIADQTRPGDKKSLWPVVIGIAAGLLVFSSAGIILKRRRHNMQR